MGTIRSMSYLALLEPMRNWRVLCGSNYTPIVYFHVSVYLGFVFIFYAAIIALYCVFSLKRLQPQPVGVIQSWLYALRVVDQLF